jgi:hypothetical protein
MLDAGSRHLHHLAIVQFMEVVEGVARVREKFITRHFRNSERHRFHSRIPLPPH